MKSTETVARGPVPCRISTVFWLGRSTVVRLSMTPSVVAYNENGACAELVPYACSDRGRNRPRRPAPSQQKTPNTPNIPQSGANDRSPGRLITRIQIAPLKSREFPQSAQVVNYDATLV